MKAKVKLLPFLLLVFIMLTANCCEKDDDPQLPPVTQTGENTFGCLVNGEVWIPRPNLPYPKIQVVLGLNVLTNDKYLDIIAYQGAASHLGFFFCEQELKEGKTINLQRTMETKDCVDAVYMSKILDQDNITFQIDSIHTGEFLITRLDTIEKVISGTFSFDAINKNGVIVEVRDGRFDLVIDEIQM
ncbi:hypothetical protein [Ancylomarina longa]|uniref:Lipoprotein n=1 Tax=Ancylomarina longa TaxID=2487017 RepID=A0A434AEI4_9BACT|nr:hypothetical protein [Ancylomarina longa]RUT72803.1 hypothetical protein DLK05_16675 [Ancylomarina longa]